MITLSQHSEQHLRDPLFSDRATEALKTPLASFQRALAEQDNELALYLYQQIGDQNYKLHDGDASPLEQATKANNLFLVKKIATYQNKRGSCWLGVSLIRAAKLGYADILAYLLSFLNQKELQVERTLYYHVTGNSGSVASLEVLMSYPDIPVEPYSSLLGLVKNSPDLTNFLQQESVKQKLEDLWAAQAPVRHQQVILRTYQTLENIVHHNPNLDQQLKALGRYGIDPTDDRLPEVLIMAQQYENAEVIQLIQSLPTQ